MISIVVLSTNEILSDGCNFRDFRSTGLSCILFCFAVAILGSKMYNAVCSTG